MWKRRSVCRSSRSKLGDGRPFPVCRSCWVTPSLILVLALLLLPVPAGAEILIAKIVLNQEEKGDFFVDRTVSGDFQVKVGDLKAIGFRNPTGTTTIIDGEPYLSLHSMTGASFTFSETNLTLAITADPSLLARKIIDFIPKQAQKVYYPRDSSLFLNYGIDYTAGHDFSFTALNLSNELGIHRGNILFLTGSSYTKDQTQERFVRLQSSITYDDRQELRRFVAGDFFASSGELGSNLNLGGVSFAKIYRIDPYFINYPTIGLTGQTALPSEANIYLNGMLLKTEKLSPGEFELRNIAAYGGAGVIDVVLKDRFGREQRLNYPFYFGDSFLLKKGLHEYSYNFGFMREKFGTDSNNYSNLAFSAFHRYGVSDSLTLGFHGEARNNLYNLGPQATFLIDNAGIVSLSLSGSAGRSSNSGGAGIATYNYQGLHAGARFSLAGFTRDYAIVASGPTTDKTKYLTSAGLSYTEKKLGTASFDYTITRKYLGQDMDTATVGYTRNLTGESTISATYRRIKETEYANEFFISLNYTPKPNHYVSVSYEDTKDAKNTLVQVQKNLPIGEGYGYRAIIERSDAAGQTTYTANPSLQYNSRYGTYLGEFTGQSSSGRINDQYHASAAGALVYVGDTFGATRPVYDSFGLVKAGDIEGVKVLLNSQVIGTTDSSGKLFVPNLGSYYQNQLAINDKDIPIDYYLSNVVKFVSPPLRSGSCVPFVIKKLQPITGTLKIRLNGQVKPVEFYEITMTVDGTDITFPTGKEGAFDIDLSQSKEFKTLTETAESGCGAISAEANTLLKPGTYQATVTYEGKRQIFTITIPATTDQIIDLGQIIFDATTGPPTSLQPTAEELARKAPLPQATAPTEPETAQSSPLPATGGGAEKEPVGKEHTIVRQQGSSPPAQETAPRAPLAPAPVTLNVPPPPYPPSTSKEPRAIEVFFRFGSVKFSSEGDREVLITASRLLKSSPDYGIVVEGHTDQIGSQRYNLGLGRDRALTVARFLKNAGIAEDRIKIKSFGKRKLKCRSPEENCRQLNRRSVIRLVPGK